MNNTMKKISFFIFGLMFICLGITLIIEANFGATSWDASAIGLSKITNLSVGLSINIIAVILIILSGIIVKKLPNFLCLITTFIIGLFIDIFLILLEQINIDNFLFRITIFLLGSVVIGFGICLYLKPNYPVSHIDNFMLAISSKFNLSISKSKIIVEIIGTIVGLLLSGPITFITVFLAFFIGFLVGLFKKPIDNFYNLVIK